MVKIIKTSGNSMYATIVSNEKIMYYTSMKFNFGDVLVYEKQGIKIAHRLFLRIFNYCVLAGDNCRKFEFIKVRDIEGKVKCVFKKEGVYDFEKHSKAKIKYTIFIFFFVLLNNITFDSIKQNDGNLISRIKQKICKKIYRQRKIMQEEYLNNCWMDIKYEYIKGKDD